MGSIHLFVCNFGTYLINCFIWPSEFSFSHTLKVTLNTKSVDVACFSNFWGKCRFYLKEIGCDTSSNNWFCIFKNTLIFPCAFLEFIKHFSSIPMWAEWFLGFALAWGLVSICPIFNAVRNRVFSCSFKTPFNCFAISTTRAVFNSLWVLLLHDVFNCFKITITLLIDKAWIYDLTPYPKYKKNSNGYKNKRHRYFYAIRNKSFDFFKTISSVFAVVEWTFNQREVSACNTLAAHGFATALKHSAKEGAVTSVVGRIFAVHYFTESSICHLSPCFVSNLKWFGYCWSFSISRHFNFFCHIF